LGNHWVVPGAMVAVALTGYAPGADTHREILRLLGFEVAESDEVNAVDLFHDARNSEREAGATAPGPRRPAVSNGTGTPPP
jgi:hypothetical protein